MSKNKTLPLTPIQFKLVEQEFENEIRKREMSIELDQFETPRVVHLAPPLLVRASKLDPDEQLGQLHTFISSFQYNHTAVQMFFPVLKRFSMRTLCQLAKSMIKYRLPLKCLEAVILTAYLTCKSDFVRFSMSFTSIGEGGDLSRDRQFRHIVLALYHKGKFGAIGLSRRDGLMNKPFKFDSLFDLLSEYQESYEAVGHELLSLSLSAPFPSDPASSQRINWKYMSLTVAGQDDNQIKQALTNYTRKNLQ